MRVSGAQALVRSIDRFFSGRLPGRLGVAVSGGSDSLALLHLLHDWNRVPLAAVTVDHGLRPGSAGEAAHVAAVCAGLDIRHDVLEWVGWDGKGNLQDQARRTRYSMMADWARERGLDAVALGHTMDDQAETVLMRLAREAGVDGLSGMAPSVVRHGTTFCRPLLDARREDLREDLRARRVRWADDPSNEDAVFERVRVRQALAALEQAGVGVDRIAGSADHLREARDALAEVAADFARERVKSVAGDLIFDRTLLNRQPAEIRRRLLVGALKWVSSAQYPPRQEALADLEAAIGRGENATLHGCRIMTSDFTLRITREAKAVEGLSGPTDASWDVRWRLEGPHAPDLSIRALGEALKDCPDWRATRLPRATLLASPAVWRGETLVAAPVAGFCRGWSAHVADRSDFAASLISH